MADLCFAVPEWPTGEKDMLRIVQNISIPNINNLVANGRRMALPVDPAFLMYSNFEHVYGRAAPQGTQGVAISQLQLLNALLGRLAHGGSDAAAAALSAYEGTEMSAAQVEAALETLRSQILQTQEASAVMPYIPTPNVQAGTLLSVVA
jgi:hypothetical protein